MSARRLRVRWTVGLALAAAALLVPAVARPSDPPHWISPSGAIDIQCTMGCHQLHTAPGGQLTAAAGNVNLCQSCHTALGSAADLPLNDTDKAVPGVAGTSHAFDVPTTNAQYGAQPPLDAQMSLRVMGGNLVCSTCHNQHVAESAKGGRARIAPARLATALGSTGTLTSGGAYTGTAGLWYLIEIQTTGGSGSATFRWSLDNGTSWMAQNVVSGTDVALNNGVTVTFTNGSPVAQSFLAGERWEFSASYPFLRAVLDSGDNASADKFCRDCHRDWVMTHSATESYDGAYKSHPVGVGLNANTRGYDRAAPLDANGQEQTGGADRDGNPTNDLRLDSGGRVQCLSCHGVHYVDANSKTVDGPQ